MKRKEKKEKKRKASISILTILPEKQTSKNGYIKKKIKRIQKP